VASSVPSVRVTGPFATLLRYNRRYWRSYAAGFALAAIFSVLNLAMPLLMGAMVDRFIAYELTRSMLLGYVGLLIGVGIISGIARYFERTLIIGASRKFEYDLRNDYFRAIQAQSREFFTKSPTGEVMARASNDINYVRELIGPGIMGTVDMLRLPLAFGTMLYFSSYLTLVALVPLPVVSILVYAFVTYIHRQSQIVQDQFGVVTTRVQENLAGSRVVQAYGVGDVEVRAFRVESEKYMREGLKLSVAMSFAWPVIGMMIGVVILLIIWQGGDMVLDGAQVSRPVWNETGFGIARETFTLGSFTAFMSCLLLLAWPLAEFGWVMTLYQRGVVSMKRIIEYLNREPAIRDSAETDYGKSAIHGAVRFDGVGLSYDGRVALSDISFDVEQGQTVAIVGPTGSGKSSIVSLLTREYEPTNGSIHIDGHDIRRFPLQTLRSGIAYVPQDTFLFSDTIRANLTFGRPGASQEEIEYAADAAQLTETIDRLANGYDTLLGERGVNLSGGQKQRLAIARAVVLDGAILILDDALSSVDTHTEEQILSRLKNVMQHRTSVIISHRVSTVRHADLILVLEGGRIIERGAHDALLLLDGHYAEMYERQLLEDELETTA